MAERVCDWETSAKSEGGFLSRRSIAIADNHRRQQRPQTATTETKNLQTPPKRRMKASSNSSRKRFRNRPHPSLGRRSWSRIGGTGRAQPNRYPDFGPPTSLPPSRYRQRGTSGCGSL